MFKLIKSFRKSEKRVNDSKLEYKIGVNSRRYGEKIKVYFGFLGLLLIIIK
jgi:hypothetical protein